MTNGTERGGSVRLQLWIRLALLATGLAGTTALAACTTTQLPASSHHVVPTTSVPATAGQPAPVPTPAAAATSDPIDSPAATQAFNQLQADLGSIDSNLSQVSSDLSNPQGDS